MLFEYMCKKCNKRSEFLIRSAKEKPVCECGSRELEKVFSTFAVSARHAKTSGSCVDGSCNLPKSPCASGMCGF